MRSQRYLYATSRLHHGVTGTEERAGDGLQDLSELRPPARSGGAAVGSARGSSRARSGESPTAAVHGSPSNRPSWRTCCSSWTPAAPAPGGPASDPQSQASMDLGGPLFESVFTEDIMLTWQRSQDYAREHGDGLRLRLRLTDAPSIAGAAVGAALRPPRQQLHRAVRAHPGRPLPRGAPAAAAADRRRSAAHPRRHLLADRPARARRRGGVATRPGRAGRPRSPRAP